MKSRKRLTALVVLMLALINGVSGVHVIASGGEGGERGSASINIQAADSAEVKSNIMVDGADISPKTKISGKTSVFEQTHAVTDKSGKKAQVYVKVVNAPNGILYSSQVLPSEGKVKTQPWVSAEQWLTVSQADSIKCTASASYGALSADAGLEEIKGSTPGDYVALRDYYGRAYASDAEADASQKATVGSGNSIRIYNHANDGGGVFGVDTALSGVSGQNPVFRDLDVLASAGTSVQATQKMHVNGEFTSTTTAPLAVPKTRTSNYGTEYDLNMQAKLVDNTPIATGSLGYYVDANNPSANKIQGAVSAADPGDLIKVAAGVYRENVVVDKSLTIEGASAGIDQTTNTIVSGDSDGDGRGDGSVFAISPYTVVSLSGMTITGGAGKLMSQMGPPTRIGGGIFNRGSLTITDCTISGNRASIGGGIHSRGVLNLIDSSVTGNDATDYDGYGGGVGGGIETEGILNIYRSDITNNRAGGYLVDGFFNGGCGGGIENLGTVNMYDGSISSNSAYTGSGGIQNDGGVVNIYGGTISNNDAMVGAGIYNNAELNLYGGSISYNTAHQGWVGDINGNIAPGAGGGVYNHGMINLMGGSVSWNSANYAGGIENCVEGTVHLISGSIDKNTAIGFNMGSGYGGGIRNSGFIDGDTTLVKDNTPDNIHQN